MEALISGRRGVALVVDEGQFASIHLDNLEQTLPRDPSEYPYLVAEARDFVTIEDVTRDEVVRELVLARDREDALQLALALLDAELPDDVRRDTAEDLEALLREDGVGDYLEGVLYAHPLPAECDVAGAMRHAREAGARELLVLLELLWTYQDTIRDVRKAWENVPRELFLGDFEHFQATLVRAAIFRDLVRGLADRHAGTSALADFTSRPELQRLSNCWTVLSDWIARIPSQPSTLQLEVAERGAESPAKAEHVVILSNKADHNSAATLRNDLRRQGFDVWWADEDVLPGEGVRKAVRTAMDNAYAVVVCFSEGLDLHLRAAIAEHRNRPSGAVLIPVRLTDCDVSDLGIDSATTLCELTTLDLFPNGEQSNALRKLRMILTHAKWPDT